MKYLNYFSVFESKEDDIDFIRDVCLEIQDKGLKTHVDYATITENPRGLNIGKVGFTSGYVEITGKKPFKFSDIKESILTIISFLKSEKWEYRIEINSGAIYNEYAAILRGGDLYKKYPEPILVDWNLFKFTLRFEK